MASVVSCIIDSVRVWRAVHLSGTSEGMAEARRSLVAVGRQKSAQPRTPSKQSQSTIRVRIESMTHFTFDNRWDEIKGKLKQRYGQLTDDDLTFTEGKGDELLARLRDRLGVSSEGLNTLLDEFYGTSGKLEAVRHKASEIADEVRAKVGVAADELKAHAGVVGEQARAQARTLLHDGEDYIRQNPRQSLVVALFAGFVAGLLIRD